MGLAYSPFVLSPYTPPFSVLLCAPETDLYPYALHFPVSLVLWFLVGIIQWEAVAEGQGVKGKRLGYLFPVFSLIQDHITGRDYVPPHCSSCHVAHPPPPQPSLGS